MAPSQASSPPGISHQRAIGLAWLVLLCALVGFVLLAAGVPWVALRYVRAATVEQRPRMTIQTGTLVISARGQERALGQSDAEVRLPEGTRVVTQQASQATLTFPQGLSVSIYEDSSLVIRRTTRARFRPDITPDEVHVVIERGRVDMGSTQAGRARFVVDALGALVELEPNGNYRFDVAAEQFELSVTLGRARVRAHGRSLELGRRQRAVVNAGQPPPPAPAEARKNLLLQPDLDEALEEGSPWQLRKDQGGDQGNVDAEVGWRRIDGRAAIQFVRRNSEGNAAEIGLIQRLDVPVSEYKSLQILATLRLDHQSLPGGGQHSTEYPLIIRIGYWDDESSYREWIHGFYYEPPLLGVQFVENGQAVTRGEWFEYDSGNLLDPNTRDGFEHLPLRLLQVEVYASGHDFDSLVDSIFVMVE